MLNRGNIRQLIFLSCSRVWFTAIRFFLDFYASEANRYLVATTRRLSSLPPKTEVCIRSKPPSLLGTNPPNVRWRLCGVRWCVKNRRSAGRWFTGTALRTLLSRPEVMTLHSGCEHSLVEVLSGRYICFYWLNCHYHKNFTVHSPLIGIYQIFAAQHSAGEITNLLLQK